MGGNKGGRFVVEDKHIMNKITFGQFSEFYHKWFYQKTGNNLFGQAFLDNFPQFKDDKLANMTNIAYAYNHILHKFVKNTTQESY
jgi:hypothetical protein